MGSPKQETSKSAGYFALIRGNRNFRYLWMGQIVSLLGDWFNLIASASLISDLSNSGIAIGGLFVVRMLSQFFVSPFAGVAADRYNRKKILILADISRGLVVLGFLLVREPEHVWALYALTAVQLGISGFFFPTRNAILPELVSREELGAANAVSSATWSVMLAFGAALGGLVAGTLGNQPAFVIDALTFAVSALLIAQIRYQPGAKLTAAEKRVGAVLRQYLEGLRYLRRHLDIAVIVLHKSATSLLITSAFQVLQVTVAANTFVIGEGGGIGLGLMYGAVGIGTGLGPIGARYFTGDRNRPLRWAIAAGYAIAALGLFVASPLSSFGMFLTGTLLRGIGAGIIWVFSTQLLLHLVPNEVRGRVFSTEFALFALLSAAGSAVSGKVIDSSVGITTMLTMMGTLVFIPWLLWTLWITLGRSQDHTGDPLAQDGSETAVGA